MTTVDQATETARRLHGELAAMRKQIANEAEATLENWTPAINREEFLPSAENLARYLAFRKMDSRALQEGLSSLGLSSLGRCESRVLPSTAALAGIHAADARLRR